MRLLGIPNGWASDDRKGEGVGPGLAALRVAG